MNPDVIRLYKLMQKAHSMKIFHCILITTLLLNSGCVDSSQTSSVTPKSKSTVGNSKAGLEGTPSVKNNLLKLNDIGVAVSYPPEFGVETKITHNDNGNINIHFDNHTVDIVDSNIIFDGKTFGEAQKGDLVTITADGTLTIATAPDKAH